MNISKRKWILKKKKKIQYLDTNKATCENILEMFVSNKLSNFAFIENYFFVYRNELNRFYCKQQNQ